MSVILIEKSKALSGYQEVLCPLLNPKLCYSVYKLVSLTF